MLRQTLGDFTSIACFKAAIEGMEDAVGERTTAIALIAAGRARGKNLQDLRNWHKSVSARLRRTLISAM
jgi:hypothetical protein